MIWRWLWRIRITWFNPLSFTYNYCYRHFISPLKCTWTFQAVLKKWASIGTGKTLWLCCDLLWICRVTSAHGAAGLLSWRPENTRFSSRHNCSGPHCLRSDERLHHEQAISSWADKLGHTPGQAFQSHCGWLHCRSTDRTVCLIICTGVLSINLTKKENSKPPEVLHLEWIKEMNEWNE